MKTKTIISGIAMAVFACLAIMASVSCKKDNPTQSMKFSAKAVEVGIGASKTVTVTGCTPPLTVTSGDAKIATAAVKDATLTVTGVAAGSTTVTVTDSKKVTGKLTVTVSK